jgi:hypothetical protein
VLFQEEHTMTMKTTILLGLSGLLLITACDSKEGGGDSAADGEVATGEDSAEPEYEVPDVEDDFGQTLIGRSYAVDLGGATFVQPPGIGAILGSLLTQDVLIGVTGAGDTTLDLVGALSVEGGTAQDFCSAAIVFPAPADFTNPPIFTVGPQDTSLAVSGETVTIFGMELGGTFSADGTLFENGGFAGEVDMRELVQVVDALGGTADEACGTLEAIGAACAACSSDGAEACLVLEAVDVAAAEIPGQQVEANTECDPARCEAGC